MKVAPKPENYKKRISWSEKVKQGAKCGCHVLSVCKADLHVNIRGSNTITDTQLFMAYLDKPEEIRKCSHSNTEQRNEIKSNLLSLRFLGDELSVFENGN
jgi:transcription elongation factor Elf1